MKQITTDGQSNLLHHAIKGYASLHSTNQTLVVHVRSKTQRKVPIPVNNALQLFSDTRIIHKGLGNGKVELPNATTNHSKESDVPVLRHRTGSMQFLYPAQNTLIRRMDRCREHTNAVGIGDLDVTTRLHSHFTDRVQEDPAKSQALVGVNDRYGPLRFERVVIRSYVACNAHAWVGLLVFDDSQSEVVLEVHVQQIVHLTRGQFLHRREKTKKQCVLGQAVDAYDSDAGGAATIEKTTSVARSNGTDDDVSVSERHSMLTGGKKNDFTP